MQEILFFGSLRNNGVMTGIYIGAHLFGLDWLVMLSFELSQFAMLRIQILDRGLFQEHGQIIILEINLLGIVFSIRYTISDYENDNNNSENSNDNDAEVQ